MKYILTMIICSNLTGQCIPPYTQGIFEDPYSCMLGGHLQSIKISQNLGAEHVNKYYTSIRFSCDQYLEEPKTDT
jgi:enhancing lycopene biosynthesis protein 2